jgi:membrane-associated phospholipid phosphatase
LVILATVVACRRRRAALLLTGAVAGALVFAPLAKELFALPAGARRDRYSFPSGHSLRTMAAATAVTLVAWPSRRRKATLAASSIVVAVSGFALVYEGGTSLSDVSGGWCLGWAWVACVWLGLRHVHPARRDDPIRSRRRRTGRWMDPVV